MLIFRNRPHSYLYCCALSLLFLLFCPPTAAAKNIPAPLQPVTAALTSPPRPGPPVGATIVADRPMLTWPKVNDAVFYEVEFLSEPPETPNGMNPSAYRTLISERLFTHGYNPDLSDYPADHFFWRVQPYDLRGNPLAGYSDTQEAWIDRKRQETLKPIITAQFPGNIAPLYPAYSWIPLTGAAQYELEILKASPENPNGTDPSRYVIQTIQTTGFTYYDPSPRLTAGDYYWRVRGLDGIGCPVGVFSDAAAFTVNPRSGNYAATFGDSLTHGGGAMSHSPAEPEYCYQTYLDFPTVNLGRSGDTTDNLLQRFSQDVTPFQPRFLLILGGTNNLRAGASAQSVINDLAALRDLCQARGIRPVFLTIPPLNPANIQLSIQAPTAPDWQKNRQLVNDFLRRQRYCIDIAPVLTDSRGELPTALSTDGLHLDIAGKQKMAAVINAEWTRVSSGR